MSDGMSRKYVRKNVKDCQKMSERMSVDTLERRSKNMSKKNVRIENATGDSLHGHFFPGQIGCMYVRTTSATLCRDLKYSVIRAAFMGSKSWTVVWPNTAPATRNLTELLLDWAVTFRLLSCYFTEPKKNLGETVVINA